MGIAVDRIFIESDLLEQSRGMRFSRSLEQVELPYSFGDDIKDVHTRVERRQGILKDDLHAPAKFSLRLGRQTGNILSVKDNLAAMRLLEPHQGSARGWFCRNPTHPPNQGSPHDRPERKRRRPPRTWSTVRDIIPRLIGNQVFRSVTLSNDCG